MNELSWILYLADVSNSLGDILVSIAILSVISFVGGSITAACTESSSTKEDEMWNKIGHFAMKKWSVFFLISISLLIFIPSSDTVYAIAASEMGETVLSSETGGKAIEALNAWLDRQIGSEE